MTKSGRYMVVQDPASPKRWRLKNITTRNLVGPSYANLEVAQAAMRRRNDEKGGTDR